MTNRVLMSVLVSCFISGGLLVVFLFAVPVHSLQAQSPTSTPVATSTPVVGPVLPAAPAYCVSGVFEDCYGDMFGKFLLFLFALLATFVFGSRQRVLLALAFVFFALSSMPLDVFAFWFFVSSLLLIIADVFFTLST